MAGTAGTAGTAGEVRQDGGSMEGDTQTVQGSQM